MIISVVVTVIVIVTVTGTIIVTVIGIVITSNYHFSLLLLVLPRL